MIVTGLAVGVLQREQAAPIMPAALPNVAGYTGGTGRASGA